MRRLSLAILFVISCATLLPAQVGAPSTIGKQVELYVRVTFENGHSVGPNVQVELMGSYGGTVQFMTTDTSGIARFIKLDPGKYKLRVTGPAIATTVSPEIDTTDSGPHYSYTMQVKQGELGAGTPAVGVVDANVPADARKEFDKASDNIKREDWKSAQAHLEKAIAIYPKYAMAYGSLALVYSHEKQNEKVVENFRKAAELDEHMQQANAYLGQFYYDNHDFKQAEPFLERASTGDPKNPQLLLALANCQVRNGEPDKALANAQKVHAIPDHKKYAMAHVIAGQILADKGDKQHARDEFKAFLQEDPGSPLAPRVKDALAQL